MADPKIEEIERKIAGLEHSMQDAVELEQFEDASDLKRRLEPLRTQLGKLKYAEKLAQEAAAAEKEKPEYKTTELTDHFATPSVHDKNTTAKIATAEASANDHALIAVKDKPTAHDHAK